MIDWLFDASKKALDLGIDAWKKDKEAKELRGAVIGRLVRELNFIEQILLEFSKSQEVVPNRWTQVFDRTHEASAAKLFAEIKTEAFDTLTNAPSPLEVFIPENALKFGFTRLDRLDDFKSWIKGQTLADVVERCYLRIKILRQRARAELDLGDVDYVIFLIRTVKESLK